MVLLNGLKLFDGFFAEAAYQTTRIYIQELNGR